MRTTNASIKTLMSQDFISTFYLVELNLNSSVVRDTTIGYDFTFNSQVFSSSGYLLSVDPPKMSSTVDREAYKVTYSDPDFSLRSEMETGILGKRLKVWIGFMNTLDAPLAGIDPGQPMTNAGDIILVYSGFVDSPAYTYNPDGEIVASIEATSPMGALDSTITLYTSKDSLQQRNPADTSFDQIYDGSAGIQLLWGKI